jgi:hypothetical protein
LSGGSGSGWDSLGVLIVERASEFMTHKVQFASRCVVAHDDHGLVVSCALKPVNPEKIVVRSSVDFDFMTGLVW